LPAALRSSMLGCEITCAAIRPTSRSERASRPVCQALSAGPAMTWQDRPAGKFPLALQRLLAYILRRRGPVGITQPG